MLFPHRTRKLSREDGFTMIELLVVVIIVAILAAIAVPVYLNLRDAAARSALKSDVNATVKKVGLALTGTPDREGVALSEIVANNGAAYIVSGSTKGESISVVAVNGGTTASTVVYTGDADLSNDGFVIRPAIYNGRAGAVLHATTTAATGNEGDYFVYGLLAKSKGAVVNYDYSYTSEQEKYSEGTGTGGSGTTASAPKLADASLAAAINNETYAGATISASGTPAPKLTATGLPNGLTMSTSGAITGTPNDVLKTYSVVVTATNPVGSDSKTYALKLDSKEQPAKFTSGTAVPTGVKNSQYAGFTVTTSGYPAPVLSIKGGALPDGLQLDKTSGVISGTPTGCGSYGVQLQAVNSSNTDLQSLSFTVNCPATLTTTSLDNAYTSSNYSMKVVAAGTPTPTVTVDKTTLPAGLTAVSNSDGTATISGTATTAGTKSVKITVSNGIGTPVVRNLDLAVGSSTVFSEDFESYALYQPYTNVGGWNTDTACYGNRCVVTKSAYGAGYTQFSTNSTKFLQFSYCANVRTVNAYSPATITLNPGTYTVASGMSVSATGNNGGSLTVLDASTNAELAKKTVTEVGYYGFDTLSTTVTVNQTTTVKLRMQVTFSKSENGDNSIAVDDVLIKRVS